MTSLQKFLFVEWRMMAVPRAGYAMQDAGCEQPGTSLFFVFVWFLAVMAVPTFLYLCLWICLSLITWWQRRHGRPVS